MGKIDILLDRISEQRVYLDTNIFIYFLDRHLTYFDTMSSLLQASADQRYFVTTGDIDSILSYASSPLRFVYFSSSFESSCSVWFFFSISARTTFSGACARNALFWSFIVSVRRYCFFSSICHWSRVFSSSIFSPSICAST